MSVSLITANVEKARNDKTVRVRMRIDIYLASAFINFISILHRNSHLIFISRIKSFRGIYMHNKILFYILSPTDFTLTKFLFVIICILKHLMLTNCKKN